MNEKSNAKVKELKSMIRITLVIACLGFIAEIIWAILLAMYLRHSMTTIQIVVGSICIASIWISSLVFHFMYRKKLKNILI